MQMQQRAKALSHFSDSAIRDGGGRQTCTGSFEQCYRAALQICIMDVKIGQFEQRRNVVSLSQKNDAAGKILFQDSLLNFAPLSPFTDQHEPGLRVTSADARKKFEEPELILARLKRAHV